MNKTEILKQAKHYFSKNKTYLKKIVLGYEFKGKNYRQWKKEIESIISKPFDIRFHLFEEVVFSIKDKKTEEIDWTFIGDLSWKLEIVLNPNIDKVYDLDKNLALKCNGTARLLTVFISDIIPTYTYDIFYMTYSKLGNFYEFGPITSLTTEEKRVLKKITQYLDNKGFTFVDRTFTEKKHKDLYSDTNSSGNASLFDVLFSDTYSYTTEIKRFCDKEIIEKSGSKLRWSEIYDSKGKLVKRTENRWTSGNDSFSIVLDNKGQILKVGVMRKEIGNKKMQHFDLDIIEAFNGRKKTALKKKIKNN